MTAPKKTDAHGPRVTWPMVLAWLTTLAMLVPFATPYVTGERPFDLAAGLALFAVLVGHLNHSPLATPGGGLPSSATAPTTPAETARAQHDEGGQ